MYGSLGEVLAEKGGQVYVISRGDTVRAAVRKMNDRGIGALVVMQDDRVIGIFTERDVLRRVVDEGRDPKATPIEAVMTTDVSFASKETSVAATMELMTSGRFRHLPVLDGDKLIGMISIGDLLRWLMLHQEHLINQLGYPGLRQLG